MNNLGLIRPMLAGIALMGLPWLAGCSEETTQSVTEVKRAFAMRAVAGEVEVGSSGRMMASEADPATLDLLDVRFDIGGAREQELLMHAERAEIIVDPDADTMKIRFFNVTSAATGGGITEEPVLITEPWALTVNAIEDQADR